MARPARKAARASSSLPWPEYRADPFVRSRNTMLPGRVAGIGSDQSFTDGKGVTVALSAASSIASATSTSPTRS
jgi:hypothetical protein